MNNIHLGIDFDNTIVLYDQIFFDLAFKKKYIDDQTLPTKKHIREKMIKNKLEEKFTEMQGEIYGKLIAKSKVQEGIISSLRNLLSSGVKISIVSHKTKYPIKGYKYNLHDAALMWLEKNKFFDEKYIGLKRENIYFEATIEEKVKRIKTIRCTHYIDDLEKILNRLDDKIIKILFSKEEINRKIGSPYKILNNWNELYDIIKNKSS